ncbi:MAG TPA: hypothetical protein VLF94_01835 [Chlamydiales bacterium]|nr:hypothetical protein [Chlamydiales bacterium]
MENQFQTLQNWTQVVLDAIKKDLKNDHLPSDPVFTKTYFGNRPLNRLTTEEIFAAYEKELLQGNEDIAAFVVNRWVFKHGDLYQHFAERLSQINPDFDEIKTLTDAETDRVLAGSVESFGAIPTFLFAVLNGVVFPQPAIERLRKAAETEKAALEKQEQKDFEQQSMDKLIGAHKREVARLQAKIEGVQKKYTTDTEALKKQIKALQKKLNG